MCHPGMGHMPTVREAQLPPNRSLNVFNKAPEAKRLPDTISDSLRREEHRAIEAAVAKNVLLDEAPATMESASLGLESADSATTVDTAIAETHRNIASVEVASSNHDTHSTAPSDPEVERKHDAHIKYLLELGIDLSTPEGRKWAARTCGALGIVIDTQNPDEAFQILALQLSNLSFGNGLRELLAKTKNPPAPSTASRTISKPRPIQVQAARRIPGDRKK